MDTSTVMKVGLFGVVFVALFLRVNCDNDDGMRAKLEAMEKRLAKIETIEKRLAKVDAMEKRLTEMDTMVTETRLAVVEQQQGKVFFTLNRCKFQEKTNSSIRNFTELTYYSQSCLFSI